MLAICYKLVAVCCVEGDWWSFLNIIVNVIVIVIIIIVICVGIDICVWIDEPIVGIIAPILVKVVVVRIGRVVPIVIPVLDNETST